MSLAIGDCEEARGCDEADRSPASAPPPPVRQHKRALCPTPLEGVTKRGFWPNLTPGVGLYAARQRQKVDGGNGRLIGVL